MSEVIDRIKDLDPRAAAVAGMAIALFTTGVIQSAEQDGLPKADQCTDVSHQLVEVGDQSHVLGIIPKEPVRTHLFGEGDNTSWKVVASQLSDDRGYTISAARLESANTKLTKQDGDTVSDRIQTHGPTCIVLPGPIPWGFAEADGKTTIAEYAEESTRTVPELEKLNPGLSTNPNSVPKAGAVLHVGLPNIPGLFQSNATYDASLVRRNYDVAKLSQLFKPTSAMTGDQLDAMRKTYYEAILANAGQVFGANSIVSNSETAFAPYDQTPYMRQHNITPAAVIDAYRSNYDIPNVAQNIQTNPNRQPVNVSYELDQDQLDLIDGLDLQDSQKQFIKDLFPMFMASTASGYHWNPVVLMAMAIKESNWGRSDIAKNDNNIWGVKADDSWKGAVADANGQEETADGGLTNPEPMVWRKYKTLWDAVVDFGLFLGDGSNSWFQDALQCDTTPESFVNGLEYKLDTATCQKLPGQQKVGTLEPGHATDSDYARSILEDYIAPYKLQQLFDLQPVKITPLQ